MTKKNGTIKIVSLCLSRKMHHFNIICHNLYYICSSISELGRESAPSPVINPALELARRRLSTAAGRPDSSVTSGTAAAVLGAQHHAAPCDTSTVADARGMDVSAQGSETGAAGSDTKAASDSVSGANKGNHAVGATAQQNTEMIKNLCDFKVRSDLFTFYLLMTI